MKTGLIGGCRSRMHALCLAAICGVMVVSGSASAALAQDNENAAAELTSGTTAESVAGATERAVGAVDPAPAGPPVEAAGEAVVDKGDVAWMMTSTLLVLLMTVPGLALSYGGVVRSKNVRSVLIQVIPVFSLLVILWVGESAYQV